MLDQGSVKPSPLETIYQRDSSTPGRRSAKYAQTPKPVMEMVGSIPIRVVGNMFRAFTASPCYLDRLDPLEEFVRDNSHRSAAFVNDTVYDYLHRQLAYFDQM